MTIKKIIVTAFIAILTTTSLQGFSAPITNDTETPGTPVTNDEARAQAMMLRLQEIKEMNKSNLTAAEKRDLRHEVKDMKKEIRATHKGLYLSIGAIIIIILLLILLL
ncbi:MAG: hypothetical protein H0W12_11800 [Chitinophagaceae bacterium]|nr:hypothetical protein [Chitinophagaceae bacterium]